MCSATCPTTFWLKIAVVNATGAIIRTNRKWKQTAKIGKLARKQRESNYITECEAAIRRKCSDAATILHGLRGVLDGHLPSFISNYGCPFDRLYHIYQILITALVLDGKRYAVVMHVDVSELQVDPITMLPNRAIFDAQLDLVVSLARVSGRQTGVMIVDVNELKRINDLHGHLIGDEALRTLAAELKRSLGPDCLVARIGGDEFGVILPSNCDALSAQRHRRRVGSNITCMIGSARNSISVSASVGSALYPDNGTSSSELLASADKAMYEGKRGR